jgi:hypothetical protein
MIAYGNGTTFYDGITSLSSLSITGNATVGGTLGVTGAQTNSSTLQATTITATSQFSGPGTGLTGTASGLSIGGSAATASTATTATNATNLTGSGTISSTTTGTTQALGTNNTTIATTAFALANGLPSGCIVLWSGSVASIPSGWYLCNGANGTPNLQNSFVVGAGSTYAVAATGGTADAVVVSHTHTATVTDPGHTHTTTPNPAYVGSAQGGHSGGGAANPDGYPALSINSATTGISVANSTTGVSGVNLNLPPYYALAYIMKAYF